MGGLYPAVAKYAEFQLPSTFHAGSGSTRPPLMHGVTGTKMKNYIRRARTDDAIELANLAAKTFEATYHDLTPVQVDDYVRQVFSVSLLQRELSDPNVLLLVAVCGEFVGYAQFKPNEVPNGITGARPIELVRLFLKRGVQRCGIGTGLLEKGFRWAVRQHYDSCWLKVWDQNQDAINFYERKKFKIVGETRYTAGGLNDRVLLMETEIPSLECGKDHI